jgi:uncharacterized protein DUF3293
MEEPMSNKHDDDGKIYGTVSEYVDQHDLKGIRHGARTQSRITGCVTEPCGPRIIRYTIEHIAEARARNDLRALSEASLGYVYQRHQESDGKSFALVSAWHASATLTVNRRNVKRLRQQLRSAHLRATRLVGHCQGKDGTWATEPWLWVHNISLDQALKLARDHEQDVIAYSGGETRGEFHVLWLYKSTGTVGHVDKIAAFSAAAVAQYFFVPRIAFDYLTEGWLEGWFGGV